MSKIKIRFLNILLALVMVFSAMSPATVYAADSKKTTTQMPMLSDDSDDESDGAAEE